MYLLCNVFRVCAHAYLHAYVYLSIAALGNGFGVVLTNRVVALVGAVLLFISMLATAFAPNIVVVIIFFGLLTGDHARVLQYTSI